jgi:chaperonin cofactor prefoldin
MFPASPPPPKRKQPHSGVGATEIVQALTIAVTELTDRCKSLEERNRQLNYENRVLKAQLADMQNHIRSKGEQ